MKEAEILTSHIYLPRTGIRKKFNKMAAL